jgi:hypothetical protein
VDPSHESFLCSVCALIRAGGMRDVSWMFLSQKARLVRGWNDTLFDLKRREKWKRALWKNWEKWENAQLSLKRQLFLTGLIKSLFCIFQWTFCTFRYEKSSNLQIFFKPFNLKNLPNPNEIFPPCAWLPSNVE